MFITGASKRAIEDHFDSDQELEGLLRRQGKSDLLRQLRSVLPSYATCIYIRQPAPLGLGHAVLCARPAVGDQPFFVHLADDLIDAQTPVLAQMAAVHAGRGGSVIGCQAVPRAETDRYGIVATQGRGVTQRITAIVEKPKPAQAPSTLAHECMARIAELALRDPMRAADHRRSAKALQSAQRRQAPASLAETDCAQPT